MNNQDYYENTLLHFLYKIKTISTVEIESLFNKVDPQLVNNVISNRTRSTSYILNGLLAYDSTMQTLSITDTGIKEIEARYSQKRK